MLIMVAIFTANTSANLTASRLSSRITGVQDLPGKRVGTWDDLEYLGDLARRGVQARGLPWNDGMDQEAMLEAVRNGTLDALVLDSYVLQFAAASTCDLATVGGVWQQVGASGQPAPHSAAEGRPARPWHHLCPTALLPPPPAPSRPVLWRRCFPLGLQRHRAAGRLQLHAGRHTEVGWAQLAGCRGTVPLAQGGSPARCRGRSRAAGCCRAVRAVVAGDMEALFSQYVDPPQPACKTSGVGDTTSQVTFSQVGGRLRWTLECRRSHAVCVAVLFGEA
jgi:hypothetical protein